MRRHGYESGDGAVDNYRLLGFSKVEFTRHALIRIQQRRVTKPEIYQVIEDPDEIDLPTQEHRHRVRKRRQNGKSVDVVYEIGSDRILIVTAMVLPSGAEPGQPPRRVRRVKATATKRKKKKARRRGHKQKRPKK